VRRICRQIFWSVPKWWKVLTVAGSAQVPSVCPEEMSCFKVLDFLFLELKASFCNMDVLYVGLGIGKL
jgi:hypothetical protein